MTGTDELAGWFRRSHNRSARAYEVDRPPMSTSSDGATLHRPAHTSSQGDMKPR